MKTQLSRKAAHRIYIAAAVVILTVIAVGFLLPIVLTVTNSFMESTEISANYGVIFGSAGTVNKTYIAEKVNLKFIPDQVSFSQYITAFVKSPAYLLKFWNSVILVVPITIFQICVALGASYCFARFTGKFRSAVFFVYIILMLMPYQVTLVPNFLVAQWLHLLDTWWAIILPGIFSPFSVFILTKFMRRIPSAMTEAAKLDGAGEWKIFSSVYIPLCKSVIYSVAILVFIDYWNMVEQPLILLSDPEMHPLSVFLSKINAGDIGLAFAVATIYMVPPLLLFLYSEDYLIDGISYSGGIKG
ncbi:carbohydrate ABC transporter permease [Yeguia hominis]|uniref:Carbohydrate ABC transporter permease n=1 Tax=Yeguia hominis TaxID=2763662 RepID=A0A926D8A3_9FIRM|nr:carbohydrate ABC transporter permease [Yeguia hominis]MBC8533169.1 carbohydrate ABC transporter permease [Yeguia hominis]